MAPLSIALGFDLALREIILSDCTVKSKGLTERLLGIFCRCHCGSGMEVEVNVISALKTLLPVHGTGVDQAGQGETK